MTIDEMNKLLEPTCRNCANASYTGKKCNKYLFLIEEQQPENCIGFENRWEVKDENKSN